MRNLEDYSIDNILYDWKQYKKQHSQKFSEALYSLWKSPKIYKKMMAFGFFCLFSILVILAIIFVLFMSSIVLSPDNTCLAGCLNLFLEIVLLITVAIFLILMCPFFYFERNRIIHKTDYFNYWIPIFNKFIGDRFNKILLEKYSRDHIDLLIKRRTAHEHLVQLILLSILFSNIFNRLLSIFGDRAMEISSKILTLEPSLILMVLVIFAFILTLILTLLVSIYQVVIKTVYLFNSESNTKLGLAKEFQTLLETLILFESSVSNNKSK